MLLGLVCFIFLFIGYRLYKQDVERQFGVDIHRISDSRGQIAATTMSYHQAQLAQLGLTFGLEGFFGAVIGVLFGPLTMMWCVLGSVFIGSLLNYYSGMYSMAYNKPLHSVIAEIYGRKAYLLSTGVICLLLVLYISAHYVFIVNILSVFFIQPVIYILIAVIIWLGFAYPRDFNLACMAVGLIILFTTAYFFLTSFSELSKLQISFDPKDYPGLKYIYPLIFFKVNLSVLNGAQALKSTLVAESMKNERFGRGVFIGMTIFQSAITVLWFLLLQSWAPSLQTLMVMISSKPGQPYSIINKMVDMNIGKPGVWILCITITSVCILSAGSIFRVCMKMLQQSKIAPNLSKTSFGLMILPFTGILLIHKPDTSHGYELICPSIAVYLLFMCVYLRKNKEQSYKHLLIFADISIGACIAYAMLAVFYLKLTTCIATGFIITFLIMVYQYYRQSITDFIKKKIKNLT